MKFDAADVDVEGMVTCVSCGAAVPADAGWCGQCYSAVGNATAPAPSEQPARMGVPAMTSAGYAAAPIGASGGPGRIGLVPAASSTPDRLMRTTRWGKTSTTFGPAGRIIATVGLLIPLAIMIVGGFAVMFSWGGALVYAATILRWGLRDVWRAGQVPISVPLSRA
jgi:hypothetical protein